MKLSGTVTFTDVRSPRQGTSKTCNIGSSAQCSVTTQRDGIGEIEVQEGGDICLFMVDSHICTAETNTTLENNYYPIKNKFKKTTSCKVRASLVAHMVKNLPAMWEKQVQTLGWEDPPERGVATHSSILAQEIPWTEKPGGLQSMGRKAGTYLAIVSILLFPH